MEDEYSVRKIMTVFQKRFFTKLSTKTNWGRNQIKNMFVEAMSEALLDVYDGTKNGGDNSNM